MSSWARDQPRLVNHTHGMTTYTVQEAETHLSRILHDVEAGEEVTILRGRTPVARLVPAAGPPRRRFGLVPDLMIPEDFDAPLSEEELALWE